MHASSTSPQPSNTSSEGVGQNIASSSSTGSAMQQIWKNYGVNALWKFKLVDIKDELRVKGLLLTGNKPEVIERLNQKYLSEMSADSEQSGSQSATKIQQTTSPSTTQKTDAETNSTTTIPTLTPTKTCGSSSVKSPLPSSTTATTTTPITTTPVPPPSQPLIPMAPIYNPYATPGILPMWPTVGGHMQIPPTNTFALSSISNPSIKTLSPEQKPVPKVTTSTPVKKGVPKKTTTTLHNHTHYHSHLHYNPSMFMGVPNMAFNPFVPSYYPLGTPVTPLKMTSPPKPQTANVSPVTKSTKGSESGTESIPSTITKITTIATGFAPSNMEPVDNKKEKKSILSGTVDNAVFNSFQPSQRLSYDYGNSQTTPPSPTRYHNPPSKLKKLGLMKESIEPKSTYGSKTKSQALLGEKSTQQSPSKPTTPTSTKNVKTPKKYQHSPAWLNKKEQERSAAAARESEFKAKEQKSLSKGVGKLPKIGKKGPQVKSETKLIPSPDIKSPRTRKEVPKDTNKLKSQKTTPQKNCSKKPSITSTSSSPPQKQPIKKKKKKILEQQKKQEKQENELRVKVEQVEAVVPTQPPDTSQEASTEVEAELENVFGPIQMVPLQLIDPTNYDEGCEDFFVDFTDSAEIQGLRKRSIDKATESDILKGEEEFIEQAFKKVRYSEDYEDDYDTQYSYHELIRDEDESSGKDVFMMNTEDENVTSNSMDEEGVDMEYHFQVHLVHDSEGNDWRRIRATGNMTWNDLINSVIDMFQCDHFGGLGLVVGIDAQSKYSLTLPSGMEIHHPSHVPSEEMQNEKPCMSADKVTLFSSNIERDDIMAVSFMNNEISVQAAEETAQDKKKSTYTLTLHVENVVRSADEFDDEGVEQGDIGIHSYFADDYEDNVDQNTDGFLAGGFMIESV